MANSSGQEEVETPIEAWFGIKRKEETMKRGRNLYGISIFFILFLSAVPAWADKASVTIQAPPQAAKDSEITVQLTITHSSNNFFHYVNWVEVGLDGQTAYRWEYSATQRPEGATFTKGIKIRIEKDTEIKAEASCNLHGSRGPAAVKILAKE